MKKTKKTKKKFEGFRERRVVWVTYFVVVVFTGCFLYLKEVKK